MSIIDVVNIILGLFLFDIMYSDVKEIHGWVIEQIFVFWGTIRFIDSIVMFTSYFGVCGIPEKIRSGDLDIFLLKPINTRFIISIEKLDIPSLLNSVISVIIIIINLNAAIIAFSFPKIIMYLLFIIIYSYLYYCLVCIPRFLSFWFIRIDSFIKLESSLIQFTYKAPGIIYNGITKIIFFYALPFGIIGTIPTQYITSTLRLNDYILTIITTFSFHCISTILWKKGIARYNSANS
ncbi:MAG: ABC transporter permease [Bacteroidales bacterium]|nr:ABC transporter permease [Bacteroidales bacterium]